MMLTVFLCILPFSVTNQMSGLRLHDLSGRGSLSRIKIVEFSLRGGQLNFIESLRPLLMTRANALYLAVILTIEALHLFNRCINEPVMRLPQVRHLSIWHKFLLQLPSSVRREFVLAWKANLTKLSDAGALQFPIKKLECFEFFNESNE